MTLSIPRMMSDNLDTNLRISKDLYRVVLFMMSIGQLLVSG